MNPEGARPSSTSKVPQRLWGSPNLYYWASEALFPVVKRPDLKDDYSHRVTRLRMTGYIYIYIYIYVHFPVILHGVRRNNFHVILRMNNYTTKDISGMDF